MSTATSGFADVIKSLATFYGIDPDVVDIDIFTMMGVWDGASSGTTVQPAAYEFEVGYEHIIWGMSAFISDPTDNTDNFARLEFNVFNTFENKLMFQKPINCGMFLKTTGAPDNVYVLPAFKKFPDRTTLKVFLSANPLDGTWGGEAKSVGICMWGAKVSAKIMAKVEADRAAAAAASATGG